MPELPEIETLRRSLERFLPGRMIVRVEVRDRRLRTPVAVRSLRERVAAHRVASVGRRSKYLLVHLDHDEVLVVHLGMSGRFVRLPHGEPHGPHTHVILELDDGTDLRFQDPRRFGMMFVVQRHALARHPRFARLGPEPLESGFDARILQERARAARKPIKNVLMDAHVVVGVGNIYACESLYRARIHPGTPARRLSVPRWARLHAAVREVLFQAVHEGGTTLQDFRDADGQYGAFQHRLHVYGRAGEACDRCGRGIRRIVQAGRSTFYCPGCQR